MLWGPYSIRSAAETVHQHPQSMMAAAGFKMGADLVTATAENKGGERPGTVITQMIFQMTGKMAEMMTMGGEAWSFSFQKFVFIS
jgi:hypothetical protein